MRLEPPIPVETPKGNGQAAFLIDYGPDQDLYWVTFLEGSRECWTYNNKDIRARINLSQPSQDRGNRSAA